MSDSIASRGTARDAIRTAVIPAQRSIRPYDYTAPRAVYGGRVLETRSGLLIGGALHRRVAANDADGGLQLLAVEMTADAETIQAALTHPRANKPRLIDEVRTFAHEMRTDPKIGRRIRARLYDATVKPVLAWF